MIFPSVIDESKAFADRDVWKMSEVCFAKGIKNIVVKNTIAVSKYVGFSVFFTISIHVTPPAKVTNISLLAKYLPKQVTIARNRAIGAIRVTFSGNVKIMNFKIESSPSPCE